MAPVIVMLFALLVIMVSLTIFARSVAVRLGVWTKSFQLLAKRYGTKVRYTNARPWIKFQYGNSNCLLKNVCSSIGGDRKTLLKIRWPDRKLKLFVSTFGVPKGFLTSRRLKQIEIESVDFVQGNDQSFHVSTNQPEVARELLAPSAQWKIQQLIQNAGKSGVEIYLNRGYLHIFKPGYIKGTMALDDFVRFGLELFDQFKMVVNDDIEFLPEDEVVVLSDVICPICSENLHHEIVTCVRCRTPHCADCWEYNGQCATFACNETRNLRSQSLTEKSKG